jgi:hypothetical protein
MSARGSSTIRISGRGFLLPARKKQNRTRAITMGTMSTTIVLLINVQRIHSQYSLDQELVPDIERDDSQRWEFFFSW